MNSSTPPFYSSSSRLLLLLRNSKTLSQIHQIHAQILTHGFPIHNNHLLSKLVDLRCISVHYARYLFDQIPQPNDYSWTSIIKAYSLLGPFQHSIYLYSQMLREATKPTNFTYPFVLKACSSLSAIETGEQIHTHVFKFGFERDVFVNNTLIDMYSKCLCIRATTRVWDEMHERDGVSWNSIISGCICCGEIEAARMLFDEMPMRRNVVCWTAMINGYGREAMIDEMLCLFLQMLLSANDVRPNSATLVCLLSACSSVSNFELGRWVSVFIDVNAMPLDIILVTALIDLHSKCGDLLKAKELFDKISNKNLVSWNAMITGYVQRGLPEEAIQLFDQMQAESVNPNEITMVNVLSACSGLGALDLGREVHLQMGRSGLKLNVIVATALVDMYSKCGSINDACLVFIKMSGRDVVLWNAMISGLAIHGNGRDSLYVFEQMEREGTRPNHATFIGVLSACTHAGLVDEGRFYFQHSLKKHGLSPKLEHYACMVDLLGRAGHLDEAVALVRSMSVSPDSIIWGIMLNACSIHQNVKLADEVGKLLLLEEDPNLGCCILLSNIYAAAGWWGDVARVRRLMKEKGMRKPSGSSWIEVEGVVHRFLVEDTTHRETRELYEMIGRLMNQVGFEGYVPYNDFVVMNIDCV